MANINEYFQIEDDGWFDHPRLRHWRKLLKDGARIRVEVARGKRGLDVGRAILCVTIVANGQERLEEEEWSDDLNSGLIKLQVRAFSQENEALRFGLAFSGAFEPAEDRVGDGFFNSVLIDALKLGPLAVRLANVLAQINVLQPNRDSKSYPDCRDLIVGAIKGRARELTRDLAYSEEEANTILSSALAVYLDERFSISDRRLLGFG
jgi:hypothetical protein